jgi:hypothetical protein
VGNVAIMALAFTVLVLIIVALVLSFAGGVGM